jgi:D-aspartate ligase
MTPAVLLGDLNMARCFAGSGITTILASSDPHEPALRSRYVHERVLIAPLENEEQALSDLSAIGRAHPQRPTLFYGTDTQLRFIARHRDRLEALFRFRMPPTALVERMVDKSRFSELAEDFGIPVPRTLSSHELGRADDVMRRLPGPWLIKPNVHDGWFRHQGLLREGPKKALKAETASDFRRLYAAVREHTSEFVVQSYVPGGEDEVHSFHVYVDDSCTVLGHFVGKKIRTYPREAGVSTYLELVDVPGVADLGFQIVRALGMVGPLKIDLKRDPRTGRFYVLELNARYNLWHYLGSACGVNLPVLAHADLIGARPEPVRATRTGVRWLSFGDDLRSFLRSYRRSGELDFRTWIRSLSGPKVHDVFAWKDPLPALVNAWNYARAVGARLCGVST